MTREKEPQETLWLVCACSLLVPITQSDFLSYFSCLFILSGSLSVLFSSRPLSLALRLFRAPIPAYLHVTDIPSQSLYFSVYLSLFLAPLSISVYHTTYHEQKDHKKRKIRRETDFPLAPLYLSVFLRSSPLPRREKEDRQSSDTERFSLVRLYDLKELSSSKSTPETHLDRSFHLF